MAERSGKIGLSHWPFDCNFFDDDIRIRKLIKYQSGKAPLVYIYLLCSIYRKRGYYLEWDDELPFVISEKLGTGYDEGYVMEVIKCCVTLGLFDAASFEKGVLTSIAIQRRYQDICAGLRRKCVIGRYSLIAQELPLNAEDNDVNDTNKDENAEDKQTIELNRTELNRNKESSTIVEPKKEADESVQSPVVSSPQKPKSLEERKHEFGESLIPYIPKYGKDMIRKFFDYWTEVNPGGKKMAWEKAKTRKGTFDVAKRLAKWASNDYERSPVAGRGISITTAVQAAYIPDQPIEQIDMQKLLGD